MKIVAARQEGVKLNAAGVRGRGAINGTELYGSAQTILVNTDTGGGIQIKAPFAIGGIQAQDQAA